MHQLRSARSSTYNHEELLSHQELKHKNESLIQKYENMKNQMQDDLRNEYIQRNRSGSNKLSDEQYEGMMLQINFDIAWNIFDEVNENNDTCMLIDLSCLELIDAQAVTKQKIFELAQELAECMQSHCDQEEDKVLCVVCSEDHFYKKTDSSTSSAPLKNAILETIREELKMDHYYISQTRTILVRVNGDTINNPVLRDW